MHVVRPEDEDRVRKEGYDRCFRKRIRKIYAKHLPHISSDEVEQDIHEAGADVREFYRALCEQYGEIAGIPLWEPPDDRPDWFPDFLNSKEEGLDEDKPESEDEAVAPKDVPAKKNKWKVQIKPAKKQAAKAPVPAAASQTPSSPPNYFPPPMVLQPKLIPLRRPMPASPKGPAVLPPPPKPATPPVAWWPPPPPPPAVTKKGNDKGRSKGKGKGKVIAKKAEMQPKA